MKNVVVVLLVLISAVLKAQDSGEFTVPFSNPAGAMKVIVDIKTGSIKVKGTARKDVLVKYSSEKDEDNDREHDHDRDRDHDGKNNRDGLKKISSGTMNLEASEYQNTVKVTSDNWSAKIEVTVEVPSNINMKIKTYNDGDLDVSNITGTVELINYNGAITAVGISGTVIAETYNGDIKIAYDKLTPDTPLSYANYNGDIDVNGGGPEISIQTYNGDIYLRKK